MDFEAASQDNTSRALARIRAMIDGGALNPAGRLPTERELSEELQVGRRTVRHALEALEAEGLIWRRQGKGTFIGQPPDPTGVLAAEIADEVDPLAVMEARLCIEPALAELCALRATAEDVARLRLLADRAGQAGDADGAELWDGSLHRLIARIAGNRIMLTAFALLDEVRMGEDWQLKRHRARTSAAVTLYDSHHQAIIDAIERRDGAAARQAMHGHLQALSDNLRKSLDGGSE